jgi:hypothetical protein
MTDHGDMQGDKVGLSGEAQGSTQTVLIGYD